MSLNIKKKPILVIIVKEDYNSKKLVEEVKGNQKVDIVEVTEVEPSPSRTLQ